MLDKEQFLYRLQEATAEFTEAVSMNKVIG